MSDRKREYSELLKDPRWQKLRLQVFERDEWACRFCGDSRTTLAVHHLHYVRGRKPWEYDLSELLTVCEDCHQSEYETRREYEEELLDILRIMGIPAFDLRELSDALGSRACSPYLRFILPSICHAINDTSVLRELLFAFSKIVVHSPSPFFSSMARKFLAEEAKE